ncbi:hypothetical protein S58_47940 [Bradyrhizobium oligotrophicum S58]|uniref:EamA domain-containing protein n=1 Tax=Bradyrhizobium oligotrophicum S58 TaxID=1245469 RepID=M4ZA78_9BRAD|nr:hypothetical protein [Bradyrhizobium oligotrophicum]BAM90773.1 hypothetical protein S58_47940 [Bradyrhizobium oligotrophicum S58]
MTPFPPPGFTMTDKFPLATELALLLLLSALWGASYSIGVLLLGEQLSLTAWAGLACVVAGVIAMTLPTNAARDHASASNLMRHTRPPSR